MTRFLTYVLVFVIGASSWAWWQSYRDRGLIKLGNGVTLGPSSPYYYNTLAAASGADAVAAPIHGPWENYKAPFKPPPLSSLEPKFIPPRPDEWEPSEPSIELQLESLRRRVSELEAAKKGK